MMSRRVGSWRLHRRTTLDLNDLAAGVNLVLRGWFGYFTAFYPTAVIPLCQRIDRHLMRWARWKYKRLQRSSRRAWAWLAGVRFRNPEMFVHWRYCRRSVLTAGRHGPYESRGSRVDLWGPGGEIPAGYPGAPSMISSSGVQVPRGGDDTNHKPRATASS